MPTIAWGYGHAKSFPKSSLSESLKNKALAAIMLRQGGQTVVIGSSFFWTIRLPAFPLYRHRICIKRSSAISFLSSTYMCKGLVTSGSAKAGAFSRTALITLKAFSICLVQLKGVFPCQVSYRGQANSENPRIQSLHNPADPRYCLTSWWLVCLDILRMVSFLAFDSLLLPPLSKYPKYVTSVWPKLSLLCCYTIP